MTSFFSAVEERIASLDTLLVAGIDPHLADLASPTAPGLWEWCLDLMDAVREDVVAVKPNAAFFEAIPGGVEVLGGLQELCHDFGIPMLLDVKRGDIGSTANAQATACYDVLGADAVTAQPWLGRDAVDPFLREGKAVFVLCHTSNPSAADVQRMHTLGGPAYMAVAQQATSWSDDVGLVVGATAIDAVRRVRQAHPNTWILAPGVGAQGADADALLAAGCRADGRGLLVPISRGISRAEHPAAAAKLWRERLRPRPRSATTTAPDADLAALTRLGCIRHGSFTLRSGATSNIYVDCRRIIGSPALLGQLASRLVPHVGDALVAGVPTAGVPLGTAVSLLSGRPLVYPRKAAKSHGTGQQVEGIFAAGDRVVLIDDVATSGISLLEAAAVLRGAGLVVERALVLIDRESGATAALAADGITLSALYTLSDLTPT